MRLIAFLLTPVALLAAVLAGAQLFQSVTGSSQAAALSVETNANPAPPPAVATPRRTWPALFGELQPPTPQPPQPPVQEEATSEPLPPRPPVNLTSYQLKGVVRVGDAIWAMVSHPTGERLLRSGDVLHGALMVGEIDEDGVWLTEDGKVAAVLSFPDPGP